MALLSFLRTLERLGIKEGMILELSIENGKIVLKVKDLLGELREHGKRIKVNVDEAERELDEDEDLWMERLKL